MTTDIEKHVYYMSWQFIDNILREFAVRAVRSFETTRIVAIARGGLPVAAILAHQLGVQRVHTVCVQSYRGARTAVEPLREDPLFKPLVEVCNSPNTLIVDDIADKGDTIRFVGALLPAARRFALIAKQSGKPSVDYCCRTVLDTWWIHFPWEVLLDSGA